MMDYTKRSRGMASAAGSAEMDVGLREYMLRVYNHMAAGLGVTGLVAMLTASSPAMMEMIFGTPLRWVVMLAPLAFVIYFSVRVSRMSEASAKACFYGYAALMGVSLSTIFLVYTGASVARAFFVTASVFGAMSLYGYTTKRDLTGIGSFLFMGLIGIIIASLVNLFLQSSGLQFAVSVLSVIIFTGLTAWDTQKIKQVYYSVGADQLGKAAIMGALNLYLDFINLMVSLLQLFGDRRQ